MAHPSDIPNREFTRWCFMAQSDVQFEGHPLPLLTILLHRVCDGDTKKFEQALDILQAAFEAGQHRKHPLEPPR